MDADRPEAIDRAPTVSPLLGHARLLIRYPALLGALALGCYVRFVDLSHGGADSLPRSVYHFHPDEETLIRASLELASPFEPSLTAYGMLPLYLLRAVLAAAAAAAGFELDVDGPDAALPVFLTARLLSALLSSLSLAVL